MVRFNTPALKSDKNKPKQILNFEDLRTFSPSSTTLILPTPFLKEKILIDSLITILVWLFVIICII